MRVKASMLLGALGAGFLTVCALGASCGDSERGPTTPTPPERPAPTLRLLVITDLEGYLEPCGCTSRPLGGIDRMAARVEALRSEGPSLVLVAGDTLFDGVAHGGVDPEAAATQEIWKAETLVDIFDRLGAAAVTPGRLDLGHGPATFARMVRRSSAAWLAAGIRIAPAGEQAAGDAEVPLGSDALVLEASLLREVGGVKIGVLGVSAMEGPDGALPAGVEVVTALRGAARAAAADLRQRGAEVVVALVRGTRRTARQLVGGVEGLDLVVQAGLDEAEAIPPSEADGTFLVHGGRQGQGLLVIELVRTGDGPFADWSEWTQAEARARLERRIRDLRARVQAWEGDDSVAEADLAEQRGRLAEMERELAGLRPPASFSGNGIAARWEALAPDAPSDAAVRGLVNAYDRRVNENNRRVFADLQPPPVPEGAPRYVGSAACESCHETAFAWWQGHAHGRAYRTLTEAHKQFNLSCVGCHVTGYMRPGGATVTHNLDGALTDVGCESCHGPGSAHVDDSENPALVEAEVAERVCLGCHTPEHSDTFNFAAYTAMITVPGHGLPPETP